MPLKNSLRPTKIVTQWIHETLTEPNPCPDFSKFLNWEKQRESFKVLSDFNTNFFHTEISQTVVRSSIIIFNFRGRIELFFSRQI